MLHFDLLCDKLKLTSLFNGKCTNNPNTLNLEKLIWTIIKVIDLKLGNKVGVIGKNRMEVSRRPRNYLGRGTIHNSS